MEDTDDTECLHSQGP